jgi:hypothetical protein
MQISDYVHVPVKRDEYFAAGDFDAVCIASRLLLETSNPCSPVRASAHRDQLLHYAILRRKVRYAMDHLAVPHILLV